MLAPVPRATWPIVADAAPLLAIVTDQAKTIAVSEQLLHDYQVTLNNVQAPVPATGIGTASGTPETTLTVTGVTGVILMGAAVTGVGIPTGTTVIAQQSGTTGGNGVYTTNQPTTASSSALTFTAASGPSSWPIPQDTATLNILVQQQTAVIRTQTALIQHYQDVLNTSETPAGSGP
jgi:hypothetical protein